MKLTIGSFLIRAALLAPLVASGGCKDPAQASPESEQGPPAEDIVRLSAEAISRSGIQLAEVTSHPVGEVIDAPAEVQLNPDLVAHVAPLVSGQLQSVDVSVGDGVRANQRLATLRSVDLGQARAEDRRGGAMLEAAQANFERQKLLRSEGVSSERAFREAQLRLAEAAADRDAARAQLRVFRQSGGSGPDVPVLAPIDGTIIERHATRGENARPEDPLFVIADTTKVWVVARVYEQDMSRVHVGARAILTLQAQPERSWEEQLGFVAPIVDEVTRTLAVRLELDNADGSLRPGLFGRLQISVGETQPVPAIPQAALQTLHGATVVFVPAGGPSSFRAQRVTAGRRSGDLVEIREGLEVGGMVVVAGAFLLKSQLMAGEFGEEE
jgi:cobalt-zinc-cadmium efflux system membrane fusion protein